MEQKFGIVFENDVFRLIVGTDCLVQSLIIKETGEECLRQDEDIAMFSVTQERPYNNEVKLAHPNKRTTFQGNYLERQGDRLVVGFEIAPYQVEVKVKEAPGYIAFELVDYILNEESYADYLTMSPPPVAEFRLVQLPVKNRKNFGEWLNVSWDDTAAVCVLATSPYANIDSERRKGYRIMTGDAVRGVKLRGTTAAILAAPTGQFMDCMEKLEQDYGLPGGVESRRNLPVINSSIYWTASIDPNTVDEHIAYAKKGGFRMMLIYYKAIVEEGRGYLYCGDYDYRKTYPEGRADLEKMLARIKAAGITPGIHFLQTHIGMKSRYVTPVADHRLNLTKYFTRAKPLGKEDTTIYVEQNPEDTVMHPKCRYLNFGGELIGYESYTTEYPYRFLGCERGAYETIVKEHPMGLIGGILDITEFGATSAYIDQHSDLQDEIADKIAGLYNAGFEFVYFDGSEGTNIPHGFHVPNAQYRVLKKFDSAPLFTEGAAKAHFSWHFLSGGNAFDVFPPDIFKAMIDRFPAEEAPRMRQDFTRLNFGWWHYYVPGQGAGGITGIQPDHYEYGTSRAAAWDCPVTVQVSLKDLSSHPRTDDILEVMRRWEDVRQKGWLTEEHKAMLKELGQEHILLINEDKDYELVPYTQITCPDEHVRAFAFERKGYSYVVFWHVDDCCKLELNLNPEAFLVEKELGGQVIPAELDGEKVLVPAEGRRYLKSELPLSVLVKAFETSVLCN